MFFIIQKFKKILYLTHFRPSTPKWYALVFPCEISRQNLILQWKKMYLLIYISFAKIDEILNFFTNYKYLLKNIRNIDIRHISTKIDEINYVLIVETRKFIKLESMTTLIMIMYKCYDGYLAITYLLSKCIGVTTFNVARIYI